MTYIRIHGEQFDIITDGHFSQTTIKVEDDFINQDDSEFNDIWNKNPKEVEYTFKATNEQRWYLVQKIMTPSLIIVGDPTYGFFIVGMITNIKESCNFGNLDEPWIITLTLYSIQEREWYNGAYFGFEKIDETHLFEEGFQRIYL